MVPEFFIVLFLNVFFIFRILNLKVKFSVLTGLTEELSVFVCGNKPRKISESPYVLGNSLYALLNSSEQLDSIPKPRQGRIPIPHTATHTQTYCLPFYPLKCFPVFF
ncbi:hypothetical protein ILYODFUR_004211 [Ilyodon furcidens]|uniref:Secreted protein n=1 Tax=Ilyodon furcidens TaxID=33524 RepID=A0ABV0VCM9_9TELE